MDPRADNTGATAEQAVVDELYQRVAEALGAFDKATAVRLAVEAVSSGEVTVTALYRDVLTPVLVNAGTAWQRGKVAIWEEHLASATVRTIVETLYAGVLKVKAGVPPAGHSVLLACPPEEAHDLGLRMVADRFDMAGWTTYFLGPDTPVEEIAAAARRLGVDAVVMSSSTHFHRLAVRHAVDALKQALPGTDIWVGGPAFAGSATGWLPEEILDLDDLLHDGWPGRAPAPLHGAEDGASEPGDESRDADAEAGVKAAQADDAEAPADPGRAEG